MQTRKTSSCSLQPALERYESAIATLEALEQTTNDPPSTDQIRELVAARTQVHAVWRRLTRQRLKSLLTTLCSLTALRQQQHWQALRHRMNDLDERMSQQTSHLNRAVKQANWQVLLTPQEREWFQFLNPPPKTPWYDRYDDLLPALTLTGIVAAICILTPVITRFLYGGPDDGVFAVIIPSIVTLLLSGAFTKTGQRVVESFLVNLGIGKDFSEKAIFGLTVLLLIGAILIRHRLPDISNYYMDLGTEAANSGQILVAKARYERAVRLNPDNSQAHFELAELYEQMRLPQEATNHYRIAVRDPQWSQSDAANALLAHQRLIGLAIEAKNFEQMNGWLRVCQEQFASTVKLHSQCGMEEVAKAYLTHKKYPEALAILSQLLIAIERREAEASQRTGRNAAQRVGVTFQDYGQAKGYSLLINLAQSYVGQRNFVEARNYLRQAIQLKADRPHAHCLLAQVYEQRQKVKKAREAWEQCLRWSDRNNLEEANFAAMARQHLAPEGDK